MFAYAARRLLSTIPLLLVGTFLIYYMVAFVQDPLSELRLNPNLDQSAYDRKIELFDLETPVLPRALTFAEKDRVDLISGEVLEEIPGRYSPLTFTAEAWESRYLKWIGGAVTGDFGQSSAFSGQDVGPILWQRFLNTIKLAIPAFILIALSAVCIGVFQAVKQYSAGDYIITAGSFLGISMPTFVFGLLLQLMFAVWLPDQFGVKPFNTQGLPPEGSGFLGFVRYGTLPIITLMLVITASEARFERAAMLEVINSDYIRTARAKGLSERVVIFKHALRNALIPLVTIWAIDFAALLTGSVVTESVFSWPGLGRLLIDQGIGAQDLNIIMAIVLVLALFVVVFNLIADLLYGVLDPRIRYE